MTVSAAHPSKVKTGKSVEFSPDDSLQRSSGHAAAQSSYQIQNKLIHQVHGQYQTESQNNFALRGKNNEGSKSPEMVCSLKNMVTGQLTAA